MQIDEVISCNAEHVFELGYKLYLNLRCLFTDILAHLNYEENTIMPALQDLFSDDEIRAIDHISYSQMLPEHMVHMMQVLIPYFNDDDIVTFLLDILDVEQEKFMLAWPEMKLLLSFELVKIVEKEMK